MLQDINLKELEAKVWKSCCFRDGLMEIFFGVLFMVIFTRPYLGDLGFSATWERVVSISIMLIAPFAYIIARKYITLPRLGMVNFSGERISKRRKLLVFLLTFQIIGTLLFVYGLQNLIPSFELSGTALYLKRLGVGLFLWGLPLSLVAYFLNFRRFVVFGLLGAFSESLYDYYGSVGFGIAGCVILITGIVLFVQFIKDYPLQDNEMSEGSI
ncbi:hypothetical protein ACFL2X_06385 [Candidatus Latescibacterota bacterium]